MHWLCKGQMKKIELQQSREALVMGPVQNGNASLQDKTGNLPRPHTKGASETLCTPSLRPGPQHRQEAPEASCCLVSLPQWLPLLLTVDTVPTVLSGDGAHGARSLPLQRGLVLQETVGTSSSGWWQSRNRPQHPRGPFPGRERAFASSPHWAAAFGAVLRSPWISVLPRQPSCPWWLGSSNSEAVGRAHLWVFIYFFLSFLERKANHIIKAFKDPSRRKLGFQALSRRSLPTIYFQDVTWKPLSFSWGFI